MAIGGDFAPERLILAYAQGIFPWPTEGFPLLWFSPDPRFVLPLDGTRVPRSVRKAIRRDLYRITADTAFGEVIRACADQPRPGQSGTWITDGLIEGFEELHARGLAHSIEAWDESGKLAGGLYGVSLGAAFFGESMFTHAPDASKIAFVTLMGQLRAWGFSLIDCQVHTDHLERFGARHWPRSRFLAALHEALERPTRRGRWTLPQSPREGLALLMESEANSKPE